MITLKKVALVQIKFVLNNLRHSLIYYFIYYYVPKQTRDYDFGKFDNLYHTSLPYVC